MWAALANLLDAVSDLGAPPSVFPQPRASAQAVRR